VGRGSEIAARAGLAGERRTEHHFAVRRLTRWLTGPGSLRLGVIAGLFVVWEVIGRWFADPLFLRPPSEVVAALGDLLADPKVVAAILTTFWELAAAFVMSVAIGLAIGLWVGLHRFSHRSVMPIILMIYATPQVTILPLFILIFGIGPESKIAFGVSHGIFPMIVTVVAGVQGVNPVLLRSAHSMGASRLQIFRWVIFPNMIPSFFTGMRLGMTAVLLGVLLAELYATQGGIGYFTQVFAEAFELDKLFGLIAILAAMAITLNELVRRAEIRCSRWKREG